MSRRSEAINEQLFNLGPQVKQLLVNCFEGGGGGGGGVELSSEVGF